MVIHLAALTGSAGKGGGAESLKHPYDYFRVNVDGTLNIFETCRDLGIRRVICLSSFSVYGIAKCPISEETPLHPNSPYGASKTCMEEVARCYSTVYGIKTVVFRPPFVCGEGQKELNVLRELVISALRKTPIIILGDGSHIKEFVHPQDVARAISAGMGYLFRMEKPYDVFVLGNKPISIKALAELVIRKAGKGTTNFRPATNQVFDQFTDHSKAIMTLGWKPTIGIEEMVARVINDVESHPIIGETTNTRQA